MCAGGDVSRVLGPRRESTLRARRFSSKTSKFVFARGRNVQGRESDPAPLFAQANSLKENTKWRVSPSSTGER